MSLTLTIAILLPNKSLQPKPTRRFAPPPLIAVRYAEGDLTITKIIRN